MTASAPRHVLLTSDFPPVHGGASEYSHSYFRHVKAGEVTVISSYEEDWQTFDATFRHPVTRYDLLSHTSFFSKPAKVLKLLTGTLKCLPHHIDHIHCGQALTGGAVGWLCKALFGIPYSLLVHGAEELEEFQSFEVMGQYRKLDWVNGMLQEFFRCADWLICSSPWPHAKMLEYGIDPGKVRTFLPSVEPADFSVSEETISHVKQKYDLAGKKIILTLARLSEHKGQDMVMRAMPTILQKHPSAVYLIVGKGPDEARLQALHRDLKLGDSVKFLSHVPEEERAALYHACDIFIMASREIIDKGLVEGFGISFLEAGLCGKPVIGGRSGGIPGGEIAGVTIPGSILHNETGWLVDPNSPEAIASAALTFLDNPDSAAAMGAAGRQRVLREFTRDTLVREFCNLYKLSYDPE